MSVRVSEPEELDRLLDEVGDQARSAGRPQAIDISRKDAGTLTIIVGSERSALSHVPQHGDPPYRCSVGEETADEPFEFFVADGHHSEMAARHTISGARARDAAHVFVDSGDLDVRVTWEEV
jgi:hypothetical protein